jgi:hypothetical protein
MSIFKEVQVHKVTLRGSLFFLSVAVLIMAEGKDFGHYPYHHG